MRDGYCKHGKYVGGGVGIDWMCGLCEDGADVLVQADGYIVQLNFQDGTSIADRNNQWYADRDAAMNRIRHLNATAEKYGSEAFIAAWLMPETRRFWVRPQDVLAGDTIIAR